MDDSLGLEWPLSDIQLTQRPKTPEVRRAWESSRRTDPSTDAVILLWKMNDSKEPEPSAFQEEDEAQLNKENWTVVKTLR